MSKEKKNRFYYSKNQNEIDEEMWNMPTRFTFVKTPDGWKQYSEWCSVKGVKCNWEDAELVYETDDEPEIIVHEGIPEFITDLEAKLAEREKALEAKESVNQMYKATLSLKDSDFSDLVRENAKLKQQLAEKDKQIETILKENEKLVNKHNVYTWGDEIQQDKIYAITGEALEFLINNQDKISFAVEQLEKVKEYIDNHKCKTINDDRYVVYRKSLLVQIDNQIKQLKEGK